MLIQQGDPAALPITQQRAARLHSFLHVAQLAVANLAGACIDGTASRNVCEGAQSAPIGSQLRGNLILIMLASDERFDSAARRQSICEDITTRLTSQNHRHQISQRSLDLSRASAGPEALLVGCNRVCSVRHEITSSP
jgi:hypothetical protein